MSLQDRLAANLRSNSIVREIQRDLVEEGLNVSAILRKARLAAKKLNLADFLQWIMHESDGYADVAGEDLPKYRKIALTPKFFNPYRGWCPIIIGDDRLYELCHSGYAHQSIDEIEHLIVSDGTLTYTYPNELCSYLRSSLPYDFEIRGFVNKSQLQAIPDAVKNILLDWAVDLEHAGIMGEGLGFSNRDKAEAAAVTQTIYAQNIGNLGNVSGASTVQNTLSNNQFSVSLLDEYIEHIRAALPGVPEQTRIVVETELQKLKGARSGRNHKIARECLSSIRTICEGAAGSLAAQGIASYVASILS